MARVSFSAQVDQSLGNGNFSVASGRATDLGVSVSAADVAAAASIALEPALTAAVAAAQLIGAGDASAEIDAVDAALVALKASTALGKTATAAAVTAAAVGEVILTFEASQITTRNQLKAALAKIERDVLGSGLLS